MKSSREKAADQEVNVLALVKGNEKYVFLYNDKNRSEMLHTLGRYASDPELSLTWFDAAVLSQKIRRDKQRQEISPLHNVPEAIFSERQN